MAVYNALSKSVFHLKLHQGTCTANQSFFKYNYRLHLFQGILCSTCLFVITIYFVLEILSESLFAVSQSIACVISQLSELFKFPRLLSLWTKTVSSAKSIVLIKFECGKWFINNKKDKGLKSSLGGPNGDLVFPSWMYCFLSERYDCLNTFPLTPHCSSFFSNMEWFTESMPFLDVL